MFAIDLRSLATFRIGVALLLLIDLAGRTTDLSAFYTDAGVLPRVVRIDMLGYGDPLGFQHQWSLHMLSGEWWPQALLIGIAAWFAIWLLIGYRTQLAAVASWILLSSLDNRNPLILDAGDLILRCMLFWSLFLPLGMRWSVDRSVAEFARLRGLNSKQISDGVPTAITSIVSAVLLMQLALMYLASASFKLHPVWTQNFSAVYYALNGDTFVTRWGLLLREFPRVMQCLTAGTVLLEFAGPILAFFPWRNHWCRGIAIVSFALFHVGLALTMTLYLFPWICITCWMLFVPTRFWDWLEKRDSVQRLVVKSSNLASRMFDKTLPGAWEKYFQRAESPQLRSPWWRESLVGILFLYIVVWNVREVLGDERGARILPHRYNGLAIALGLSQNWSMFAPIPRIEDGWLVMKGTLRDGTEVNLWEPGRPLPWVKPALVSALFPNARWRRCLENLPTDQFVYHRQFLADWLQQRWDREFSNGIEEKKVAKVEIIREMESTPPPGEPIPVPEPVELCVRYY